MNYEETAMLAGIIKLMSEKKDISAEEKIMKIIAAGIKPEYKRNAEILLKYVELENAAKRHKSAVSIQSGKGSWRRKMLEDISKTADGKKKLKINMILKIMELDEIIKNL